MAAEAPLPPGGVLLAAGDPLPEFRLCGQDGQDIAIHNDSIAGDPVVLFLCADGLDVEALTQIQRYSELAGDFKRQGAHVFIVTGQTPDANRALAESLEGEIRILSDAKGELLGAFGLAPERGVVLSAVLHPNLRIATIIDGAAQADAALAGLDAPAPGDGAVMSGGLAPVLIVDNVFPPEFCDFLMDLWHSGDKHSDQVTCASGDSDNALIKQRTDHLIYDDEVCFKIHGFLARRLIPEMNKAFRFEVTRAEVYRIGCYDAEHGGYFRRHRDLGAAHLDYRTFAMSLNLNTGDYEGGHLIFPEFGPQHYQAPRGGCVVFSCSLLHEALTVTKGRRFALFTFFAGKTLEPGTAADS